MGEGVLDGLGEDISDEEGSDGDVLGEGDPLVWMDSTPVGSGVGTDVAAGTTAADSGTGVDDWGGVRPKV